MNFPIHMDRLQQEHRPCRANDRHRPHIYDVWVVALKGIADTIHALPAGKARARKVHSMDRTIG